MRNEHGLSWSVLALAVLGATAAIAVSFGASSAPAGGTPEATLIGYFDKASYAGNAAYKTTFVHQGKSQTHVRYHNVIPVNGDGDQAEIAFSTCAGTFTPTEFVCNPIKLKKGETATVVVVWETFPDGSSAGCDSSPCMANAGYWTSDAGTNAPQKPKKLADVGPVETALLAGDDENEAATYALEGCDPEDLDTATLKTNADLSNDNPLATIVCIPDFENPGEFLPGLIGSVLEAPTDQAGAVGEGSEVCVAAESCATPFQFDSRITFVFLIDEDTFFPPVFDLFSTASYEWDPESPVTTVFHDGVAVPLCDDMPLADPCVESIESDGEGTTTVVATGTDNGSWDFG
jgi:hypothetical protein